MKLELPPLPYASSALEPFISRDTVAYHYQKHEQGYLDNVNRLIANTPFEEMPLEEIVQKSSGALFNNASQAWNHLFYFVTLSPEGEPSPTGALAEAIAKQWGDFETFKKTFVEAGTTLFGSGWVWLVRKKSGELAILALSNAETPLREENTPLLCFDVWEHAYYLDYQNRRAEHLNNLWSIINWRVVEGRY